MIWLQLSPNAPGTGGTGVQELCNPPCLLCKYQHVACVVSKETLESGNEIMERKCAKVR